MVKAGPKAVAATGKVEDVVDVIPLSEVHADEKMESAPQNVDTAIFEAPIKVIRTLHGRGERHGGGAAGTADGKSSSSRKQQDGICAEGP